MTGILYLGGLLEEQLPVVLPLQEAWFEEEAEEDLILQTLIINFYQDFPVEGVVDLHVVDLPEARVRC